MITVRENTSFILKRNRFAKNKILNRSVLLLLIDSAYAGFIKNQYIIPNIINCSIHYNGRNKNN